MKLQSLLLAAAIAAGPVILTAPAAYADQAAVYTGRFNNVAVQGYDPVAYFTEGQPVKGLKDHSVIYQDAEFRFSSAENLATFNQDPEKYAPQYGGYCAWAVSQGSTAKGDKDNWTIVDGKLYLNFNKNIQNKWNKDREGFIASADAAWPDVLSK